MDRDRIDELIDIYSRGLLEDTVPFWTRYSVDHEYGGYLTFLDRDGSLFGTDKPVWLQGRIIWMFSRLYNRIEKRPEWLELARHGLDFLLKHCFDTDGRAFFLVTRDGTVSHRMKGNLWKGPYHLSRMQMMCWKLLEEMREGSQKA